MSEVRGPSADEQGFGAQYIQSHNTKSTRSMKMQFAKPMNGSLNTSCWLVKMYCLDNKVSDNQLFTL